MAASMRTAVAIASGILVLGAGIGAASIASADTTPTPSPTSTPTSTATPSSPAPGSESPAWPTDPDQAERRGEGTVQLYPRCWRRRQVRAALEQVRAAYGKGRPLTRIWTGGPGILTQEEADANRQAVEQGARQPRSEVRAVATGCRS